MKEDMGETFNTPLTPLLLGIMVEEGGVDGGSKCAMRRDTRRPPLFCRRSLEACAHMRVTTARTVFGSFSNFLQLVENGSLYIYIYICIYIGK